MFSLDVLNIVLRRTEESLDWTKVPKGQDVCIRDRAKIEGQERGLIGLVKGTEGQDVCIRDRAEESKDRTEVS